MARKLECQECGGTLEHLKKPGHFCSTDCRKAFNNRRALRGSELYDLFMEMRFNRSAATSKGSFAELCALASSYRETDKQKRAGRQSWDSKAHQRLPLGRTQTAGDKR